MPTVDFLCSPNGAHVINTWALMLPSSSKCPMWPCIPPSITPVGSHVPAHSQQNEIGGGTYFPHSRSHQVSMVWLAARGGWGCITLGKNCKAPWVTWRFSGRCCALRLFQKCYLLTIGKQWYCPGWERLGRLLVSSVCHRLTSFGLLNVLGLNPQGWIPVLKALEIPHIPFKQLSAQMWVCLSSRVSFQYLWVCVFANWISIHGFWVSYLFSAYFGS